MLLAKRTAVYNARLSVGVPVGRISKPGEQTMSDTNTQEMVSRNMLALFLIGGSLGAIIMSWIAYSAMIGRAL